MKFKRFSKKGGLVVGLSPRETRLPASPTEETAAARTIFAMRRILVPIDFSEGSQKALEYAAAFARQFGAELILLHVVQPYPPIPEMSPVDGEFLPELERRLKELQSTVEEDVLAKSVVRRGEPYLEIVETAREFSVDLIILATQGRTGLTHLLLGSTAERVVRHAGTPVLVVRERERDFIAAPAAKTATARIQKRPLAATLT